MIKGMKTMVRNLISEFIRFMSWLCFEHEWTRGELMIIGAAVLLLLLFILRLLRKETVAQVDADELPERSPVIGLRLADHKRSRREIRRLERRSSASAQQRRAGRKQLKEITGQVDTLKGQIHQLQREITEHKRTETHLKGQVAKLTTTAGEVRRESGQRSQADLSLEQRLAELAAVNKQLRDELTQRRQTQIRLEQQVDKLTAANTQPERQVPERRPLENIPVQTVEQKPKSKRSSGPLNTEELSRLAELGKRLAPRRPT
jgi:chromosome segregation ATPase